MAICIGHKQGGIQADMTNFSIGLAVIVLTVTLTVIVSRFIASRHYPDDIFEVFAKGDLEKAKELLSSEKGLINGKSTNGWTALHFAAWKNQSQMVKLLIDKGAPVNEKDPGGKTPICFTSSRIVADILIAHGAVLTPGQGRSEQGAGKTGLHSAPRENSRKEAS